MATSRSEKNKFVVLYHKSKDEVIKMTKASPYKAAKNSAIRFERIGIAPCTVAEIEKSKRKKRKASI